ncbi:hypothetical protein Fcan01_22198 [Folsomia candida]|uniref:Uncharacterized protein n=1 Tax=Folsomia candida TaxID=158441 RepID=A0A226DE45_FOLCA|nr:hypothetical protein Fcan01_22198 [Folsomia candida]
MLGNWNDFSRSHGRTVLMSHECSNFNIVGNTQFNLSTTSTCQEIRSTTKFEDQLQYNETTNPILSEIPDLSTKVPSHSSYSNPFVSPEASYLSNVAGIQRIDESISGLQKHFGQMTMSNWEKEYLRKLAHQPPTAYKRPLYCPSLAEFKAIAVQCGFPPAKEYPDHINLQQPFSRAENVPESIDNRMSWADMQYMLIYAIYQQYMLIYNTTKYNQNEEGDTGIQR